MAPIDGDQIIMAQTSYCSSGSGKIAHKLVQKEALAFSPTPRRQKKMALWFQGQPSLQCEFQTGQGYVVRASLKN